LFLVVKSYHQLEFSVHTNFQEKFSKNKYYFHENCANAAPISNGPYKYGKPFRVDQLAIQPRAEDGLQYIGYRSHFHF
jgi:hypothetical protein